VSSISVDGMVQREEGRGVIVREVQSRLRSGKRVCEPGNPLLEVPFPLGSRDRSSRAIVIIEGLKMVTTLLDVEFGTNRYESTGKPVVAGTYQIK
jgi:hypothetical protein